jgi:hypothetical protein
MDSSSVANVGCARRGSLLRNRVEASGSCSSAASVTEHSPQIQASDRLVQGPESFHQIGIQFKELTKKSLWDLGWRQVHPIQGSEQSQEVELSRFETGPEITRHGWRGGVRHGYSMAHSAEGEQSPPRPE